MCCYFFRSFWTTVVPYRSDLILLKATGVVRRMPEVLACLVENNLDWIFSCAFEEKCGTENCIPGLIVWSSCSFGPYCISLCQPYSTHMTSSTNGFLRTSKVRPRKDLPWIKVSFILITSEGGSTGDGAGLEGPPRIGKSLWWTHWDGLVVLADMSYFHLQKIFI